MVELFKDITATGVIVLTLLLLATATINMFFRVPYVPSNPRAVRKMVKMARLKKGEIVYDLGCGDGRLLIEAERKNVDARGYELAPIPFLLAQLQKLWNRSNVKIYAKNFFDSNLKDANVIFCYLGPETMAQLYKKLKKECRKGTKIISNTFTIHGVKPVKVWAKSQTERTPSIYMYEL